MRKTLLTILSAASAAICGHAQTAYDAFLFSENNYEGTARTMAMGNAFTALGGDLGSVAINPAGSAVAGYSQITITPSLTFSASTTQGVPPPGANGSLPYFENRIRSNATSFSVPNIGVTACFDTHRTSGLKNIIFGFVMNKSAGWNEDVYASGTNSSTSFMGAMAYEATIEGLDGDKLGAENAYNSMPWKPVVGYQSGMISTFGDYDDDDHDLFVGASEVIYDNGEVAIGGPLNQSYGRIVNGGKYDYLFNIAANISDFIYIGANLGVTSIEYGYDDYFKEGAVDPADFQIDMDNGDRMYFKDMRYRYAYNATGTGYYGKLGIIVTPGLGFRIGAAIQTPTVNNITEQWYMAGETTYTDSRFNASAESPTGESAYRVVSPCRANLGLAYAFGNLGVISVDYEMCDYGQMKYMTNGYDRDYFDQNEHIKNMYGAAHYLRTGVEVKPLSYLSVRGGYNLATSAQVAEYDPVEKEYYSIDRTYRHNVSIGLGFSSKKSFFADLACRYDLPQKEFIIPYSDYLASTGGALNPEILNRHSSWKVLLTLGWRF